MQTYLGGFKHFIILTLFGKMFQFDSYFSDGWFILPAARRFEKLIRIEHVDVS